MKEDDGQKPGDGAQPFFTLLKSINGSVTQLGTRV